MRGAERPLQNQFFAGFVAAARPLGGQIFSLSRFAISFSTLPRSLYKNEQET
jgi:hypothetical protein